MDTKNGVGDLNIPFLKRIKESFLKIVRRKRENRSEIVIDIMVLLLGVVFSRAHVIFGAYPLALALLCALRGRVWVALFGAIVGALSLGKMGIIYAMIYLLCVILRLIISLPKKEDNFEEDTEKLTKCKDTVVKNVHFGENMLLRISVAVVGAFIAGVYEVLLDGLSFTTVAFAVSMIAVGAISTLIFSLLSIKNLDIVSLIFKKDSEISFDISSMDYKTLIFGISALCFAFLLGLSLSSYQLFGISLSYIFSSLALIVASKRFGAFVGGAVGFASALGLSGVNAVAFALAGIGAGFIFPFGTGYALTVGALSLSAFSAYTGGVVGLVSVLPEYIFGALLSLTLLSGVNPNEREKTVRPKRKEAEDMVGTMALSYRDRREEMLVNLKSSLINLSGVIKKMADEDRSLNTADYAFAVESALEDSCATCAVYNRCKINSKEVRERIALEMQKDGSCNTGGVCTNNGRLSDGLKGSIAKIKKEHFERKELLSDAASFDFFARFLNEDIYKYRQQSEVDEPLSERIEALSVHHGLKDCVAKVFGKRERYVVIACEDKTGSAISNPEFIGELERALGVRLSSPQYYRKGDMALMESHADSTYMLVGKGVGVARRGGVSGDKMSFVDTPDGYSLALLTDGMGTGKSAKRVSDFASEIIAELLKSGRDKTTSLHLLNKLLNQRPDESAVAVDLFIFDRILGEGTFVKSGGAPSYIKRGNSVYRIKSETAPLGSMPMLDCEKIRVEVSEGDFIIMLSDGVSQSAEDSPWLLDFLSKPYDGDESSLARDILDLSKQNHNGPLDDMSVLVAKIKKV